MYSGEESAGMMSDFLYFPHSQWRMKYLLNGVAVPPHTEPPPRVLKI